MSGSRLEIKLDGNTIYVEPGKYVHDELSDTWITWELLDQPTIAHLEILVNQIESTVFTMRTAVKSAVDDIMVLGKKSPGEKNILVS